MLSIPTNYQQIITGLKNRIREARLKAAVLVNRELLNVYWEIGNTILGQQKIQGWGAKVIERLATDLKTEFPDFKGLSVRNLKYMRTFADAWPEFGIVQQSAAQIESVEIQSNVIVQQLAAQMLWGHHQLLLDKVKNKDQRLFYMQKANENGWSRDVMAHQIETGLFERSGKAITNFKSTLPAVQSDLAQQTIKNPYIFDFLSLTEDVREAELEKGLIQHLKKFMLELGKGFAWVGNQKNLVVEGDDFFLDLLFYNYHLHCFVNFELKIGEFKPEYAGKLNFYVNTIDQQLKGDGDNPTIGILLCKTPNETVIKYSLQGIESPIGVTSYQFEKALPEGFKAELPTIEELEKEIEESYKELKNPSEKKLDKLKEMLKNLKEPEVKEKKSKENAEIIFDKAVKILLAKMMNRYEKEIRPYFQDNELSIYIDNHGFPDFEKAEAHFREEVKYPVNDFKLEYRSSGFKPAGRQAFNCWTGLQIQCHQFKYSLSLVRHVEKPLLEKLYHETLTDAEENELVEKWMEGLVDDITGQLGRIGNG